MLVLSSHWSQSSRWHAIVFVVLKSTVRINSQAPLLQAATEWPRVSRAQGSKVKLKHVGDSSNRRTSYPRSWKSWQIFEMDWLNYNGIRALVVVVEVRIGAVASSEQSGSDGNRATTIPLENQRSASSTIPTQPACKQFVNWCSRGPYTLGQKEIADTSSQEQSYKRTYERLAHWVHMIWIHS